MTSSTTALPAEACVRNATRPTTPCGKGPRNEVASQRAFLSGRVAVGCLFRTCLRPSVCVGGGCVCRGAWRRVSIDFPKTPELFGFSFTPGLILVGKDGNIAQLKGGYRPGDEVDIEVKIRALTAQ
jgi:hypothetical protein